MFFANVALECILGWKPCRFHASAIFLFEKRWQPVVAFLQHPKASFLPKKDGRKNINMCLMYVNQRNLHIIMLIQVKHSHYVCAEDWKDSNDPKSYFDWQCNAIGLCFGVLDIQTL